MVLKILPQIKTKSVIGMCGILPRSTGKRGWIVLDGLKTEATIIGMRLSIFSQI